MPDNLRRVAIVTGAARGIGAATACRLARDGMAVAALDLEAGACGATVAAITAAGGQAMAVGADVSQADQVEAAVGTVAADLGPPTVLVNNAGVIRDNLLFKMSGEDWDTVLDTNLKGQFLMAKYAIPEMRNRGGGAVVNLASVQALISQREVAAYAASKGGVVSLTKTLALDHAKDRIRINSVLPGSVRTPMLHHAAELAPVVGTFLRERWERP